jgi:cation diffusion facilitator family transporter
MATNLFLAAAKLAAGIFGHSHALVADAIESFADVFSSLVVWRALVVAAEPADADHPYGHGKAEPIASAVVAGTLLLAAGWIIVTSVKEIQQPHFTPAPFTLVVLVVVILVKEILFRFVLREANSIENIAIESDAWHHRSDAITSAAAFIGITVAIIGGEGYEIADDIAAGFAALVIGWNGWRLLRSAMHELMDRSPGPEVCDRILRIASSTKGVDLIEKCLVRKTGYHLYVDLHAHVDPNMTVAISHEIAHRVKDAIRAEVPAVLDVMVHVEPYTRDQQPE